MEKVDFILGPGYISSNIPPLVTIQIQYSARYTLLMRACIPPIDLTLCGNKIVQLSRQYRKVNKQVCCKGCRADPS